MPNKLCSVDSCLRNSKTNGMCGMHYQRFWKHGSTDKRGSRANGEGGISSQGYKMITVDGKRKAEHIHICEKALGKPLPKGSEVHHFNEIKTDNRKTNLAICPSPKYHQLLHARQAAMDSCGNPEFRKCRYCGEFDDTKNLYIRQNQYTGYHNKCRSEARKKC